MDIDSSSLPANEPAVLAPEFPNEPPHISHPRIEEDLIVPWGLVDLFVLVALAVFATFVLGILVVGLFVLAGTKLSALEASAREQGLVSIVTQALIDVGLMGYLALQIRLRFHEPFWKTIGWRPIDSGVIPRPVAYGALVFCGVIVSFAVDVASNLHPPKGNLPIDAVYQDPLNALLFLLMAVLLAPLVEETIFRGYIYPVIGARWGELAGILVTGSLFGLLHGFQLGGALWQIVLLVVVGIVFTWVRASAKTVAASYCLHMGYNSFLFAGFLASTHLLHSMPPH